MLARILNTLIGIWLGAAPAILNFEKTAAHNDYIVGPFVASFSIIAFWEATRGARKINTFLGLWLFLAPMILYYENIIPVANDMFAGILIVIFSFFKWKIENQYGGGWKAIWQNDTLHEREAENAKKN